MTLSPRAGADGGAFHGGFYESFKQLAILVYHRRSRIDGGCGSAGFYTAARA